MQSAMTKETKFQKTIIFKSRKLLIYYVDCYLHDAISFNIFVSGWVDEFTFVIHK